MRRRIFIIFMLVLASSSVVLSIILPWVSLADKIESVIMGIAILFIYLMEIDVL